MYETHLCKFLNRGKFVTTPAGLHIPFPLFRQYHVHVHRYHNANTLVIPIIPLIIIHYLFIFFLRFLLK